uniref:Uncharacterized protein n=2 Tax=Caenorhabditis japonica TaxID=281687 RepID=A0A8R1EQM0_CAEJA
MRQFNSALALASMSAQVEEFRGHAAGPLHPPTGMALSYGQLYIMDTKQAAEESRSVTPNKNCDRSIMKSLRKLLAEINAFAKFYKKSIQMLRSAEDETVDEIKMYLDCRYIYAPEALHHIYRFPCQKKSDVIYRLSIHLPDRQTVAYHPDIDYSFPRQIK